MVTHIRVNERWRSARAAACSVRIFNSRGDVYENINQFSIVALLDRPDLDVSL